MMFGHSKRTRRRRGGGMGGGGDRAHALKRPIIMITSVASFCAFTVGTVFGRRFRNKQHTQRRAGENACYPATEDPGTSHDACNSAVPTDALDCAVCLEELCLPRVSPCGHSFCTPCLSGIISDDNYSARKCPTCRRRVSADSVSWLPVNFAARAIVEARARASGPEELERFYEAENAARNQPCNAGNHDDIDDDGYESEETVALLVRTWNWFKWTAIIVTELGAFLVSLKEVLDSSPSRPRRFQALV